MRGLTLARRPKRSAPKEFLRLGVASRWNGLAKQGATSMRMDSVESECSDIKISNDLRDVGDVSGHS